MDSKSKRWHWRNCPRAPQLGNCDLGRAAVRMAWRCDFVARVRALATGAREAYGAECFEEAR
jgi:hypothetical protein